MSLCHLFDKNVHHIVPLFQRPYVWERETQWQPLWDDTQRLAERLLTKQPVRSHFLGATVHEKKAPPGSMETRLVIDGQQRLTTLQLLLQAFTDVATAGGFETYGAALRNLTRNNHPLRQRPQEDFKLWPTNADRADFRKTMEAGSAQAVRSAFAAGARRMVCRLNTRGYGRLFIELLRAIDGPREDIPQRVYIRLSAGTAEVDRWPSDMEFRDAWLSAPLYDVLTRPRLRLLLEALEMAMRSGKLAETQQVPPSLTVEHVMPQSWEEHWPCQPTVHPTRPAVVGDVFCIPLAI